MHNAASCWYVTTHEVVQTTSATETQRKTIEIYGDNAKSHFQ